jgi:hypothetical protein
MSDDDRTEQVLEVVRRHSRTLPSLAETRCPYDGRLLGAAYWLSDGLWVWSTGHRQPPQAARRDAARFYLDALDECQTADERRACYDAASQALSSHLRPVARPAVLHLEIDLSSPSSYCITDPTMTMIGGGGSLVTEVSCGCRRHFYLDLHSIILLAAENAARAGDTQGATRHVPPLPPDVPAREAQRLLRSNMKARA